MCSNMEQIIAVIGNVMDELKALCQQYSKDTVGPSLKLDSLNGTVMKGLRETLSWNRRRPFCESAHRGGVKASAQLSSGYQQTKTHTKRSLSWIQTDGKHLFEADQQVN